MHMQPSCKVREKGVEVTVACAVAICSARRRSVWLLIFSHLSPFSPLFTTLPEIRSTDPDEKRPDGAPAALTDEDVAHLHNVRQAVWRGGLIGWALGMACGGGSFVATTWLFKSPTLRPRLAEAGWRPPAAKHFTVAVLLGGAAGSMLGAKTLGTRAWALRPDVVHRGSRKRQELTAYQQQVQRGAAQARRFDVSTGMTAQLAENAGPQGAYAFDSDDEKLRLEELRHWGLHEVENGEVESDRDKRLGWNGGRGRDRSSSDGLHGAQVGRSHISIGSRVAEQQEVEQQLQRRRQADVYDEAWDSFGSSRS